mmetsp:Transcript_10796/g.30648  ORF Transcript_10796/g.30648 Transcript_10796/m.30648 type:complete len:279 (-) Transcript_10796:344-1180(-)
MLITGMPSSCFICWKNGIFVHGSGHILFMTSTGTAEINSSASMISPFAITMCFTESSSFNTHSFTRCFINTLPPFFSMLCFIGSHKRSGWLPSKNAICKPSVSFKKRFIAVNTTVMDNLSGSIKSNAFAMEINTSSLILSGMPYFLMKSVTDNSSCLSIKSWPSINIGNNGGAVCNFSGNVNIFWFNKMAKAKLNGAGMPLTKSNVVNSPGNSCIAKIILCTFHCKRSSMSNSLNKFIMFGYAPKKMCKPVSIQSPSLSFHAETLPPKTSLASKTIGS